MTLALPLRNRASFAEQAPEFTTKLGGRFGARGVVVGLAARAERGFVNGDTGSAEISQFFNERRLMDTRSCVAILIGLLIIVFGLVTG
jgi:hypothetical protein